MPKKEQLREEIAQEHNYKLPDDYIINEILPLCLSSRQSLQSHVEQLTALYNNAEIAGKLQLQKYVKTISGLIYSADTVAFDIRDDLSSPMDYTKLKQGIGLAFYNGIDIELNRVVKEALLYGSSFVKLVIPPDSNLKPTDLSVVVYKPSDAMFYYPHLDAHDDNQIIVLANRMPVQAFLRKYGVLLPEDFQIQPLGYQIREESEQSILFDNIKQIIEKSYTEPLTGEGLRELEMQTDFKLSDLNLRTGELIEYFEVYYKDHDKDRWNLVLVHNNQVFYHGVSPYIGALTPVIGFSFYDIGEKTVYGKSIVKDINGAFLRLRQYWEKLERIIEFLINPPLIIASAIGGIDAEVIKQNLRPEGIVVLNVPDTKFEHYVPKINPELMAELIKSHEQFITEALMLNQGIMSGQFKNVRSYAQLALLLQSTMSDVKHYALVFESILEVLATQIAYAITYYIKGYEEYLGRDFVVEVFAHSSSPLTSMQYQDMIFAFLDAGLLQPEDVIDLIPIPNKSKVIMRARMMQVLQKLDNQNKQQ